MGSRINWSTIVSVTLALTLPAGPALALGFGQVRTQALLGQPLNLALPVSLGEGETLTSECAAAEILAGDSVVQPVNVRTRVTQGRDAGEAVLRIVTTVPIDEPVLSITVSAGCPTRITRTLVVLADPPLVSTVAPTVAAAPDGGARNAAAGAAMPAPAAEGSSTEAAPRATRPSAPPRATRRAAPRTAATPRPQEAGSAPVAIAAPSSRATAPAAARAVAPVAGRPRLQLDGGQVGMTAAAAAALAAADEQVAAARTAAAAAEAAASAAQQRAQALEAEMVQLRAAAKAQTAALDALRAQIASDQAQRQQQGWLIPLLLGALALLAAVAVWLAFRLREQRPAGRTSVWWDKAGPASVPASPYGSEPSEYGTSSLFKPSAAAPLKVASAPAPLTPHEPSRFGDGLDSLMAPPTVPAPVPVPPPPAPAAPARDEVAESKRPVSVDEQIDLEQQADFFIALGHDESAIDLLMAHLRSTGGGTPLPFLKLLEIHRRRGDREAYERTRVRFNQRFNSVAPEWQADPQGGRSLDAYPLVVGRIQHAWPNPLDSMAELEALLFRRGAGSEMFDLPAYQEVLFLYQLARDLHQAEQPDEASNVDVLLPIGGAAGAAAAAGEGSIVLRPEFNDGRAVTLDLDLDLSGASRMAELAPVTPASTAPQADLVLDLEGDAGASGRDSADDLWSADPGAKRRDI